MKTQQKKVLDLLKQGMVNSHDLTYIHSIKQAPTRIKELREQGYVISSSPPLKNKSVNYTLQRSEDFERVKGQIIYYKGEDGRDYAKIV